MFDLFLPKVNLLYLGLSVLILLDLSYLSRFWTQFEAWLSMQEITANGIRGVQNGTAGRCKITCLHNASESLKSTLIDMWSSKTPEEAHSTLSRPDVTVTNQKDKDLMLPTVLSINELSSELRLSA